jgi:hypothetical protein
MTPRLSLFSKIVFAKNKATTRRRLKLLLEEAEAEGRAPRDKLLFSKSRLNCA